MHYSVGDLLILDMWPGWTKTDCRIYYCVATHTDPEEKEGRRKDGWI